MPDKMDGPELSAIIDINKLEGRRRERSANEYMANNPCSPFCSRCGDEVPGARGEACLCWHCLDLLARLRQAGYFNRRQAPERACADCGKERRPGKRFCDSCAAKRRREATRRAVRKNRRQKRVAL